jgi:hypothetical protein
MKVAAIMALFIMQVCLFSVRLSAQKPAKYYDAAGKELSKAEFDHIERTQNYLGVIVDSTANAHQLVRREEWGVLPSAEDIYSKLETATGKSMDRNKYLLILYYPGKDRCNSSGMATPADYAHNDSELTRHLQKIAPTQVVHIYKDSKGLKKLYGNLSKHYQDPGALIERTFFKYHYPCGSYVIIRPDGAYGSYFGEYAYEDILERAKALKKKQ